MIGNKIFAKTKDELWMQGNPTESGQGEAIPYILYDSQTYVNATTTTLTFFQTTNADRTLTNLQAGGQLPDPQWFEIHNLGFDPLIAATTEAGTQTGALDDIQNLMLINRPIWTLFLLDKQYGPFPLSFLHTSGGAQGVGYGTFTAEESIQVGLNSYPDGGWNWQGGVLIPPKVNFSVVVQWAAATTLSDAANKVLRFWMSGTLYRKVV